MWSILSPLQRCFIVIIIFILWEQKYNFSVKNLIFFNVKLVISKNFVERFWNCDVYSMVQYIELIFCIFSHMSCVETPIYWKTGKIKVNKKCVSSAVSKISVISEIHLIQSRIAALETVLWWSLRLEFSILNIQRN